MASVEGAGGWVEVAMKRVLSGDELWDELVKTGRV